MMLIKLFVGLPGCGKTFELNRLGPDWVKIDDPKSLEVFPASAECLAIADPWFCVDANLEAAKKFLKTRYGRVDVEVIYFENDPAACAANVAHRNDGRKVEDFSQTLTKIYQPPAGSKPVWKPTTQQDKETLL